MGAEPCTPEHRALPHALSCQTEGRKRRNTSRKISTGFVIYGDLCGAPRLPVTSHSPDFLSSSLSFLRTFYSSVLFLRAFLRYLQHTCASSTCTLHTLVKQGPDSWLFPHAWIRKITPGTFTPCGWAQSTGDRVAAMAQQNQPWWRPFPASIGNFLCPCNDAFPKMF